MKTAMTESYWISYLFIQSAPKNPAKTASCGSSNSSSTRSKRRRRRSSRGKPVVENDNGDAGSSYTTAKAANPPSETRKSSWRESRFPCTDSVLFVAVVFCRCLLFVSIKWDLHDRMAGLAPYQQTRICWDETRSTADFFLILPSPSPFAASAGEKRGRVREREREGDKGAGEDRVWQREGPRLRVLLSACACRSAFRLLCLGRSASVSPPRTINKQSRINSETQIGTSQSSSESLWLRALFPTISHGRNVRLTDRCWALKTWNHSVPSSAA